jgi:hypothetical protein
MERKAKNAHDEMVFFGGRADSLQFLRERSMLWNASSSVGNAMGRVTLCSNQRKFFRA